VSAYSILVVDDIPETAKTTAELLELHGFKVYVATDVPGALRLLEEHRIHLALLDLCLTRDGDPTNGGLDLALQIDPSIPKIIFTKFPSFDTLYNIFPGSGRSHLVVDYVLKRDGTQMLVQRVRDALQQYAPINWELKLRWSERPPPWQRLSLPRLLELVDGESGGEPAAAHELGDLLRMLFKECDEIVVERAVTAQAGRAGLEVRAGRDGRVSGQYFVVYGLKARVRAYERRRQEFAPRDGDSRALHPELFAETTRYAAYGYLVSGVRLAAAVSLQEYYRTAEPGDVTAVLDDLLGHALRPWYARAPITEDPRGAAQFFRQWLAADGAPPQERDLRRCSEMIAGATLSMSDCPISVDKQELVLRLSDGAVRRLPIPARALNVEYILAGCEQLAGTLNCALDRDSVLVDAERNTCALVEFDSAALGPLCVDYVALEHWLRLQLPPSVGIEARLRCEEQLLAMPGLTVPPDIAGLAPEAQKLMRAVARVRYLAGTLSPARDLRAYHAGLLFAALRHILHVAPGSRPDDQGAVMGLAHSLICAALLFERLAGGRAPVAVDPLERVVVIEGREVRLAPQLFRLFEYLHARRGKTCSKADLLRDALETKGIANADDVRRNESVLQNLVSRLREEIEPDPEQPLYLRTVRGIGYRLDLPPDPEG
jgi:DNA-binding response OmpR family regulator